MNPIRNFQEFKKEGIVKIQSPDLPRSAFLVKESERSFSTVNKMIKKIPLSDDNANSYVKLCYDIIMEFIRARMLLEGLSATGPGAHEAEVSYLREIGIQEEDVQFADQLR